MGDETGEGMRIVKYSRITKTLWFKVAVKVSYDSDDKDGAKEVKRLARECVGGSSIGGSYEVKPTKVIFMENQS